jgi:ABC-type transporter Mla subunit MlaD
VILAASQAFSKSVGLIITFGGIGVIVNVIVVLIAIQIRGERRQNRQYRERMLDG